MYEGQGRLSETEYEAALLHVLAMGVRLAAASLPERSPRRPRLDLLADDLGQVAHHLGGRSLREVPSA